MRRIAFTLSALLFASSALAAGVDPASATPVQREQANARFLKGKAHFDKNEFPAALEDFRASLDIVASPNARLYIARTLREMGRLVEAYVEYGRTAAEAKEHEREEARYGKAAVAALAERDSIAPQIGFVNLAIANPSDTTSVKVAGSALVRAGWTEPVPVTPGNVDVDVETAGIAPIHCTIAVHAGEKAAVSIDAMSPPAPVAVAPLHVDTGAHDAHAGKGWMLPVAIAGGGVGVVGLVMFTVAGVMSQSTYSDLKTKCGLAPCPASLQGEVSGGQTQQAVANTGLVLGIVGIVVGGAFLTLWMLPSHHASASVGVTVGPGSLGLAGTF